MPVLYHQFVTVLLRHFRVLAGRYALAVAVCQLAVLSSSTLVLAASRQAGALTVGAAEECSCEHTPGVMCPMHRRSTSRPAPADAPRWCKGVDNSTFAVLPAFGALAMPERVAPLARPVGESPAPAFVAGAPRPLDRPPDSPPPRL